MQGKSTGLLRAMRDDRVRLTALFTLNSGGTAAAVTAGHGVTSVTQSSTGVFYATLDSVWTGYEDAAVHAGTAGTATPPGWAKLGKVDLANQKIWFFTGTAAAPSTPAATPNALVSLDITMINSSVDY